MKPNTDRPLFLPLNLNEKVQRLELAFISVIHTFQKCYYNKVNRDNSICILVCCIIFKLVLVAETPTVNTFI